LRRGRNEDRFDGIQDGQRSYTRAFAGKRLRTRCCGKKGRAMGSLGLGGNRRKNRFQ
jgi:hypothetical protein